MAYFKLNDGESRIVTIDTNTKPEKVDGKYGEQVKLKTTDGEDWYMTPTMWERVKAILQTKTYTIEIQRFGTGQETRYNMKPAKNGEEKMDEKNNSIVLQTIIKGAFSEDGTFQAKQAATALDWYKTNIDPQNEKKDDTGQNSAVTYPPQGVSDKSDDINVEDIPF